MLKLVIESKRETEEQLISDLKSIIKDIENDCWGSCGLELDWEIRDDESDMRDELSDIRDKLIFETKSINGTPYVKFVGLFNDDDSGWFFMLFDCVELPMVDFLNETKREKYLLPIIEKAPVRIHRFETILDAYTSLKEGFKPIIIEGSHEGGLEVGNYYAISSIDLKYLND